MRLPNAERLIVEPEKIVGYLLNQTHRYGASKARFFSELGFRAENWGLLAQSLRDHGRRYEVTNTRQTAFGPRYEIEGVLYAPDGKTASIKTVWQHDHGQLAPRLITAYPLEEGER